MEFALEPVELCLAPASRGLLGEAFADGREAFLDATGREARLREKREKTQLPDPRTHRAMGVDPGAKLRKPLRRSALVDESRAAQHHGVRAVMRKELLFCEDEGRLCPPSAQRYLAAQSMKDRSVGEGEGFA